MRKLLFCGDAVAHTGLACVTHNVLKYLHDKWEIHVLGVNYHGDPHHYPYKIYPADTWGKDQLGFNRIGPLYNSIKPDVVLILADWWLTWQYRDRLPDEATVAAYIPVDGEGLDPVHITKLNRLDHAIWYTEFGKHEAEAAGYQGRSDVIPHGVDLELFRPLDRTNCREQLGLFSAIRKNDFLIGNINRNQPRKRMDLSIAAYAKFLELTNADDAFLYLHCERKPVPGSGWDIDRCTQQNGVVGKVLLPIHKTSFYGHDWEFMPTIFNAMDVQITTTIGEGWSLPTAEGAACGIPQLVPSPCAGLTEWMNDQRLHYKTIDRFVNLETNVYHTLPDVDDLAMCLASLYESHQLREEYGQAALAVVSDSKYRWPTIADRFHRILDKLAGPAELQAA